MTLPAEPAARGWVDPERCRDLYRSLVAGVGLVTAAGPSGPVGMTASSILAVSVTPPLLLVSLANSSRTLAALGRAKRFAVNLLQAEQRHLAERFAGGRPAWARFAELDLVDADPPVLAGAFSSAVCDLEWSSRVGDHTLVVGGITAVRIGVGQPLVWHGSGYHYLPGSRQVPDTA